MSAFARLKKTETKDAPKAGNDNKDASNSSLSKALYKLVDTMSSAYALDNKGPSALPGLAIALAGDDLKYPIGHQLSRIADAFERIADVAEAIAIAEEYMDAE